MVVLAVVTIGSARLAMVRRVHSGAPSEPAPSIVPAIRCSSATRGPVAGRSSKFGLVELANELGVETVMLDHGLDLEQLAATPSPEAPTASAWPAATGPRRSSRRSPSSTASRSSASPRARGTTSPSTSASTATTPARVYAFRDAVERRIDYATVNGRFFVNNVSLGVYATIVQQEGYRDAKVDTTKALLPELLGPPTKPFDLQFTEPDGTEVDGAFLIQVSNNPYVLGARSTHAAPPHRHRQARGLRAHRATGKDEAALVTLSAIRARQRSPNWHEFTAETFEVRSRSGKAYAGVDGEALEMETPIVFQIFPRGLRLLVPSGNLQAAEDRLARNVGLQELLDVARGRP